MLTQALATPRSGTRVHPPSSSIAAQSAKAAHLGDQPAMGASLAKTGVSEDAALAAQGHTLHHTTVTHDASAPYLGPSGGAGSGLVRRTIWAEVCSYVEVCCTGGQSNLWGLVCKN